MKKKISEHTTIIKETLSTQLIANNPVIIVKKIFLNQFNFTKFCFQELRMMK